MVLSFQRLLKTLGTYNKSSSEKIENRYTEPILILLKGSKGTGRAQTKSVMCNKGMRRVEQYVEVRKNRMRDVSVFAH